MTCKKFEDWMASEDATAENPVPDDVSRHLNECAVCREVHDTDRKLESSVKDFFTLKELPDGFMDKIDTALTDSPPAQKISTVKIFGALAAAGIIGLFVYFQFYYPAGRFENLQQLSLSAVSRHLKADTTMTFNAVGKDAALATLSRELGFNVILPDLASRNFTLLGGRLCVVGNCKTAYLFYELQGRTCSLFILDYGRFDFEMADGSRFYNILKGCRTDIWKENGQVYTLVY